MAKAKKEEKKGQKHGQQNPDRRGSVSENVKDTLVGKSRKRALRKLGETQHEREVNAGEFHIRVNEGRNTSILDLMNGKEGLYALPGGNTPSAHFRVEVRKHPNRDNPEIIDRLPVVFFESAQAGHELAGAGCWSTTTFAPCFYIGKHGLSFVSKMEDLLQKTTQEMLVHYPAKILLRSGTTFSKEGVMELEDIEEAEVSTDVDDLGSGIFGDYTLPNGVTVSLVENEHHGPILKVLASPEGLITSGTNWSLKASATKRKMFPKNDRMTQEMYNWLKTLHGMIKMYLPYGIDDVEEVKVFPIAKVSPAPAEEVSKAVTHTTVVKTEVIVKFNKEEARPMCPAAFLSGYGTYFYEQNDRRAYFLVEKVAGDTSITLVSVEEGFPGELSEIFAKHGDNIRVSYKVLGEPCVFTWSELNNPKEARKALRMFLNRLGRMLKLSRPNKKMAQTEPVSA